MKYHVFDTEAEAIIAEKAISDDLGYSKPGVNAATGAAEPNALTVRWAIPQPITDGRWVFPSPDQTGIDAEDAWWPKTEMKMP
jgi:hypothetical protein